MLAANPNSDTLRSLSQIFTTSNFNKVVRKKNARLTEKRITKYYTSTSVKKRSYTDIIGSLYGELQDIYRNEYFYKNALFNKYFLEKYSLKTTSVFNEFKIGGSIADFVMLNGNVRVFEIKSDLDGLEKLEKQTNDYKQFADLVYIVTCSKFVSKILADYSHTTIGIIEFTTNNTFHERKAAESNAASFSHETIFKTLRKSEYLDIIKDFFGYLPDVPNTKIFSSCIDLANEIGVCEFQKLALNKLKERKIKCPDLLESNRTPFELKHICYTLDFSEQEYNILYQFLDKKA